MRRIYLDVDGVINSVRGRNGAFPTEAESGWSADSWRRETINGFPISWSTELVDELNRLVADGVEVRWLTTWCEFAQSMIAPRLGLKGGDTWKLAHGVLHDEISPWNRGRSWWKTGVFEADLSVELGDKVVWIDDDHGPFTQTAFMNALTVDGTLFTIAPFFDVGITRRDIAEIRDFFSEDSVQDVS